jgi:hypothetical protein
MVAAQGVRKSHLVLAIRGIRSPANNRRLSIADTVIITVLCIPIVRRMSPILTLPEVSATDPGCTPLLKGWQLVHW